MIVYRGLRWHNADLFTLSNLPAKHLFAVHYLEDNDNNKCNQRDTHTHNNADYYGVSIAWLCSDFDWGEWRE